MPYTATNMTVQSGTQYKANIDADTAALQGVYGKRRNVNGDGFINQLVNPVAISASWQYILDMWEAEIVSGTATGNFGQQASTSFPGQVSIGTTNLATTAASTLGFRTKMLGRNVSDLLFAPYLYPIGGTLQHPFGSLSILAFQNSGSSVNVTPTLRSANSVDNFSTMSNSIGGATLSLPSGVVTQLVWDGAATAFQLDTLTNFSNGIALELDFAMPNGLSGISLQIGDVQFEGGQVATSFGRGYIADELLHCQRFYEKSYDLGVAPGTVTTVGQSKMGISGLAGGTYTLNPSVSFKVVKHHTPIITLFSPGTGAAGKARDAQNNTDVTGTAADIGLGAFDWSATAAAATTAVSLGAQWVADARL